MEQELIAVRYRSVGSEEIPGVDARELHEFLEVGRDFSAWIAGRIEDGGFIEGEDFSPVLGKSTGGRPTREYIVSLDMAKHLAMLERNEKGKLARQFFIECAKRLHALASKPMTMEEIIFHQSKMLMDTRARLDTQQALIEKQETITAKHEHTLLEVNARINNLDGINIDGTPRRVLNVLVRKYARKNGMGYDAAWNEFVRRFNLAYGANLKLAIGFFEKKFKRTVTVPEYLETSRRIEDGVRVADKMVAGA